MAENEVQIRVRIPKDFKEELDQFAADHNRSFNQEVLSRLMESKYELERYHDHVIPDYLSYSMQQEDNVTHKSKIDIVMLIHRISCEINLGKNQLIEIKKIISNTDNIISQTALREILDVKTNYINFLFYCLLQTLILYKKYFPTEKLSNFEVKQIKDTLLYTENIQITYAIDKLKTLLTEIS